MVRATTTIEPRLERVPVRLPLPPADKQGSIYENQKGLEDRFFTDPGPVDQSALGAAR